MEIKFFIPKPTDLNELRNFYRKLAFQYHPDCSPYAGEEMKAINNEFEYLTENLAQARPEYFRESEIKFSKDFIERIDFLVKVPGITIEIIGNWLWVTGDTKPIKDQLKDFDFQWAFKKQAWFYKNYKYHKKSKKELELEEIRNLYHSETINGNNYRSQEKEETKTVSIFNN